MILGSYNVFKCLLVAIKDTVNHDGIEHAGYLSFLIMLSLFPFLVFFMAIVGFIGSEQLGLVLVEIINNSALANFIDALKPRIIEITATPPQSLLTIAIVSAIWTASSIFEGTRTILNRAYRVDSPPAYLLRRLLSIAEFFIAVSIIIVFLFTILVLPHVFSYIIKVIQIENSYIVELLSPESIYFRYVLLFLFIFFVVCILYYSIPNRKSRFITTFPGSAVVISGWYLFSQIFKYYLGHFPQVNFIYGSIAGVIVALLYFYACSIIFIVGAEFNYQLENKFFKHRKK